ncbi:phosphocholine-specific phospholipase C [Acetobacter conturbans]|uniref:phospholipase C n=1 Tax=Acetobacter conturbans TaxID=1737472 RepID=A0ABX0K619_9PROT|nr:phospholipase C, phosphocholine-specific [Acetobacter conturbans]NHN90055.1 phospholipase C, phosphocholine-specific [Acetobacter conturbans]
MSSFSRRRDFLKWTGAVAAGGLLPANVRQALAIPANFKTGTIQDVEHVVILMQENRSFDHYFGCLNGVRGFGDPRVEMQRNGHTLFSQPDGKGEYVLPFRFETIHTSSACLASLDHSWKGTQSAWNNWDAWIPRKTAMTMGYFSRAEIPYYYALADAFTICDNYHASIFGPTNPNRLYFFTGTSGLAVGNENHQAVENADDGNWTADMKLDHQDFQAFQWETYPECLQKAGVSWKVYQEYDNFGDNSLAYFSEFRNISVNSWQYLRGRQIVSGSDYNNKDVSEGKYLVQAFERDVANGSLPQVSWIVPPTTLSEHPNAPPGYGEYLISELMDVFVRHPEVWAKTVFILTYDENDGFFDHLPPPVPALKNWQGGGNVSTHGESYRGEAVGLGPRVPTIVMSPWTKGGWVNSQVFDHTSILRFLEARFGVEAPLITQWRREICGDLTSVFDFASPSNSWNFLLPNTDEYLAQTRQSCTFPPPKVPVNQIMPLQEKGQRLARAIPYDLHADLIGLHVLRLKNAGKTGAVFRIVEDSGVRHFSVAARSEMLVKAASRDFVSVQGPNGFYRKFDVSAPLLARLLIDDSLKGGSLFLSAFEDRQFTREQPISLEIANAYNKKTDTLRVSNGDRKLFYFSISEFDHWYDISVIYKNRTILNFSGHVETGRPSRTDRLIGQQ